MTDSDTEAFLASIQPVVLVGGRSERFGRDKLREPWGAGVLVERPISALREVFGPRVKVVGECHPEVWSLADGVIQDLHPGVGPIGGIASALQSCSGPVFILAGDMPDFSAEHVLAIVKASMEVREVVAVLARGEQPNPCAGVYFPGALEHLRRRMSFGESRLHDAIQPDRCIQIVLPEAALRNINMPSDP